MSKITFPIGRMVWGSCYEAQTKNFDGTPLVIKTGPDAGKPTQKFAFGVAIPKGPEQSWAQTPWGQLIVAEATASFPRGEYQQQSFAWKITDGDSTAIKKGATRPINQATGYAGHWVISFSSTYAPKLCKDDGKTQLLEPNFIKTGHFIQVAGSVAGNKNLANPGVYINHEWVNWSFYGEEIVTGSDPLTAGFGGAAPAGAMLTPPSNFAPAGFVPGGGAVGLPVPGAIPGAPAALPQTRVLVDVPGAAYTVAQCRSANPPWNDDQIISAGYGQWQVSAPAASFVAVIPNAPALPNPVAAVPLTPASPAAVAPLMPTPIAAAPPARMLVQVPGAQYTIEQCKSANPPWSDDVIVQQGIATWGVAPPAGVNPVPSFLGQ